MPRFTGGEVPAKSRPISSPAISARQASPKRLVDALDVDRSFVGPVGQGGDPVPDGPLALVTDRLGERCELLESVLVHEVEELAAADLVAGHVRHQVAEDLLRHPHVAANDVENRLVEAAGPDQLADGQAKPLVVNLRRGGPESEPPDVRQMGDAHRVADDASASKYGPHHVDVEEVTGAHPRVRWWR